MKTAIVAPSEFLVVCHRVLNGNTYDAGKLVEDTLTLGKYTAGRAVVPCFEGDILQVRETGEVVLTHQDFIPLSKEEYKNLKGRKLAVSLEGVLDKIAQYKQQNPNQKIILCFELKGITRNETINKTVRHLKEYGLLDAYFDSFSGRKLDAIVTANKNHKTEYARSLHLIGNIGKAQFMMARAREGYDILTIPHPMSFGNIDELIIYGAVGSTDILERIAECPLVQGAYVRFSEGTGIQGALVKLWNSLTNTKR